MLVVGIAMKLGHGRGSESVITHPSSVSPTCSIGLSYDFLRLHRTLVDFRWILKTENRSLLTSTITMHLFLSVSVLIRKLSSRTSIHSLTRFLTSVILRFVQIVKDDSSAKCVKIERISAFFKRKCRWIYSWTFDFSSKNHMIPHRINLPIIVFIIQGSK